MKYQNIGDMFFKQAQVNPKEPIFWSKIEGKYQPTTWRQAEDDVKAVMSAFLTYGYKAGDKIAIQAENRYEWPLIDLAAISMGMMDVPLYPSNTADQVKYVLEHSETKTIAVSSKEQLDKVLSMKKANEVMDRIIVFDNLKKLPKVKGIEIVRMKDLMQLGLKNIKHLDINKLLDDISGDSVATIIYTSGTTANPKGVCLSHNNFLTNARDSLGALKIDENHKYLSFLPLSHVFERTAGLYTMLMANIEIAYAESMETIAQNMVEVQPTVILGVPRFFEKLYARIKTALDKAPPLKKTLINMAMDTQSNYCKYLESKQTPPFWLKVSKTVLDAIVLKKLHAKLGGKIQFMISGGAPINPEICEAFQRLGINIFQGYGLTETSPVIAVNDNPSKLSSVGQIIKNVKVKFDEDGEILVKGPNIMQGYYRDPEGTEATMTPDGWLRTGDIGKMDKEGYLYITDRKKDIIITSGGKNVAPSKIEGMLKNTPFIEHALIVGDKRKFLAALLIPDHEFVKDYAKQENVNESLPNMYSHPKIQKAIHDCVQQVNRNLAAFEQIKKYRLITDEFSIDSGDLTPTLKIKKKYVITKYSNLITDMYSEA